MGSDGSRATRAAGPVEGTLMGDGGPSSLEEAFAPFRRRMESAGMPRLAIRSFQHYYGQLWAGEVGTIPCSRALPVDRLPDAAGMEDMRAAGVEALGRCAVIKLNGGLGTSMGMQGPKSLLPVRGDLTFFDIIVSQVLALRREHGVRLPLVLMNSFATAGAARDALAAYPELDAGLPLEFEQHRVPKVDARTLAPARWPADPELEWCPPGHGDIYAALRTSGMLEAMLEAGYRYAFVSNSDNLGATLDLSILGDVAEREVPFLMEVADRTSADRKGGHLARRPGDGLMLRELAQCPEDEVGKFQDIERYRFFNTNNLWLDLAALAAALDEHEGVLGLPLIRNEKPIDPTQPDSPRVYQLETAMGSAIGLFPGAAAVRVSRERFAPVKRTDDLLLVWSDAYALEPESGRLAPAPPFGAGGRPMPEVTLDAEHFSLYDDLCRRFPHGAPSLAGARSLRVEGDVIFGSGVAVVGDAVVRQAGAEPGRVPDGARLSGVVEV